MGKYEFDSRHPDKHMERSVDTVLHDLQAAIAAYQDALAEYTNEKKQRLTKKELDQRLALFRINAPFLSYVFFHIKELEASFLELGISAHPPKGK